MSKRNYGLIRGVRMDERDVTIQEVRERLVRIETLLETKLFALEDKVKEKDKKYDDMERELKEVKTEVKELNVKLKNLETNVNKTEDNSKWLWRTVIGGFITAAIAIYLRK